MYWPIAIDYGWGWMNSATLLAFVIESNRIHSHFVVGVEVWGINSYRAIGSVWGCLGLGSIRITLLILFVFIHFFIVVWLGRWSFLSKK